MFKEEDAITPADIAKNLGARTWETMASMRFSWPPQPSITWT